MKKSTVDRFGQEYQGYSRNRDPKSDAPVICLNGYKEVSSCQIGYGRCGCRDATNSPAEVETSQRRIVAGFVVGMRQLASGETFLVRDGSVSRGAPRLRPGLFLIVTATVDIASE